MRYLKRVLSAVLAILCILIFLLCAFVSGAFPCSYQTDHQIEQLFADMDKAMEAEDYATAFHYMSPSYRQSHVPNDMRNWMDTLHFHLEPQ
jgi:hypothetical protein